MKKSTIARSALGVVAALGLVLGASAVPATASAESEVRPSPTSADADPGVERAPVAGHDSTPLPAPAR